MGDENSLLLSCSLSTSLYVRCMDIFKFKVLNCSATTAQWVNTSWITGVKVNNVVWHWKHPIIHSCDTETGRCHFRKWSVQCSSQQSKQPDTTFQDSAKSLDKEHVDWTVDTVILTFGTDIFRSVQTFSPLILNFCWELLMTNAIQNSYSRLNWTFITC